MTKKARARYTLESKQEAVRLVDGRHRGGSAHLKFNAFLTYYTKKCLKKRVGDRANAGYGLIKQGYGLEFRWLLLS